MNASNQADESIAPRKLEQETDIRQQLKNIYNESRRMAMLRTGSPIDYMVESSLALISQTVSSYVIGEDEKLPVDDREWDAVAISNQLRAEQRQALERLLGRDV